MYELRVPLFSDHPRNRRLGDGNRKRIGGIASSERENDKHMRSKFILIHCAVALAILLSVPSVGQSGNLRAGASKVDISPTPDLFPLVDPIPFINGGEFIDVHDPLWARALVLDNGSSKVAMITVDSSGIPSSDELIKQVSAELKIPAANVLLLETRLHNCPWAESGSNGRRTETPYAAILKRGIVEAARQANANLQPARIGFGTGSVAIDPTRPDSPPDKTVSVLLVTKPSGEPIAVYSSYAAHPVVMFRALTRQGRPEISADLGGATSNYVEEHLKGAVAIWNISSSGTQRPAGEMNFSPRPPDARNVDATGWAKLDAQGSLLGEEIVRVAKNIQNTESSAVLWAAHTELTCIRQKCADIGPPPQQGPPGQTGPPARVSPPGQPGPVGLGGVPAPAMAGETLKIPIALLMVNDIAIAAAGSDVLIESAQHLKRDSLFARTFMVSWIPSSAGNTRIPADVEPALIDAFVTMERTYLPILHGAAK